MKKLLFLICLAPSFLFAQDFHLSFRGGFANYQGDLQQKACTFKQAKFAGSSGGRYDLTEHLLARAR